VRSNEVYGSTRLLDLPVGGAVDADESCSFPFMSCAMGKDHKIGDGAGASADHSTSRIGAKRTRG
jgi:hypothetical protein